MSTQEQLSRITIDLPKEEHKRLKRLAIDLDKSMKELVLEAIRSLEYCPKSHIPNQETLEAIKEIEKGENLIKGKEAEKI